MSIYDLCSCVCIWVQLCMCVHVWERRQDCMFVCLFMCLCESVWMWMCVFWVYGCVCLGVQVCILMCECAWVCIFACVYWKFMSDCVRMCKSMNIHVWCVLEYVYECIYECRYGWSGAGHRLVTLCVHSSLCSFLITVDRVSLCTTLQLWTHECFHSWSRGKGLRTLVIAVSLTVTVKWLL